MNISILLIIYAYIGMLTPGGPVDGVTWLYNIYEYKPIHTALFHSKTNFWDTYIYISKAYYVIYYLTILSGYTLGPSRWCPLVV